MRLLYVSNSDWNLYLFRLPLARCIRAEGHEIVMAAPYGEYAGKIEEEGFRFEPIRVRRSGMNPIREALSIGEITRTIRMTQPRIVHNFTAKGVLYGATAARLAEGSRVVNSITGLGYIFASNRMTASALRPAVKHWYRRALRSSEVIFQNRDDLRYFLDSGLISPGKAHLVLSSGVDTDEFAYAPEMDGPVTVMFLGRMLYMKGVEEFVAAARSLHGQARFVLVGDTDPGHPSAIARAKLQEWHDHGYVEWWGQRDDISDVLAQCHVMCLPTSGREGVPRSLLEAASVGRPLIATDNTGCREIVRDEINGLVVPMRDSGSLANAILRLVHDRELRRSLGKKAREIVEDEFSVERVAAKTLEVYDLALRS